MGRLDAGIARDFDDKTGEPPALSLHVADRRAAGGVVLSALSRDADRARSRLVAAKRAGRGGTAPERNAGAFRRRWTPIVPPAWRASGDWNTRGSAYCGTQSKRSAAAFCWRPSEMDVRRILIVAGIVLLVAGLLWPYLTRLGLGRLPGDIVVERENFRFYFPARHIDPCQRRSDGSLLAFPALKRKRAEGTSLRPWCFNPRYASRRPPRRLPRRAGRHGSDDAARNQLCGPGLPWIGTCVVTSSFSRLMLLNSATAFGVDVGRRRSTRRRRSPQIAH